MSTTLQIVPNNAAAITVAVATPGPKGDPSAGYYLAAHDSQDQTNPTPNAVNLVKFRTTNESDGVSIVSDTRITFANAGVYNVQFSLQLLIPSGGANSFDVWFRKNGTNIANSNTRYYLGNNEHGVAALNFVTSVQANDYLEVAWSSPSSTIVIESESSLTTPTRPNIPSAILTVTQVR